MNAFLKGVRPFDYVLAGLMTAAGAVLMYGNIAANEEDLPHALSSTSWAMLPAFALVTVPILWRRRGILAVIGVTAAATAGHVLAFGWITSCGVVLPLSFALAYAVARFAGAKQNHVIGLAGIVVTQLVMLVRAWKAVDHSSIRRSRSARSKVFSTVALYHRNPTTADFTTAGPTAVTGTGLPPPAERLLPENSRGVRLPQIDVVVEPRLGVHIREVHV